MNFPVPPIKTQFLQKDGTVHPNWLNYFSNLHLQVSGNLADDGFILPSVEASTLPLLASNKDKSQQSRIVHNTTDNKYYVNITSATGTSEYKAIQTEP